MKRTMMSRRPSSRLRQSRNLLAESQQIVRERDFELCVICAAPMQEIHHRRPRGMGGASRSREIHSPASLLSLCAIHHAKVESHRSWAISQGYLLRDGQDPTVISLNYRGKLATLDNDGGIEIWDDDFDQPAGGDGTE